jgi:Ni,Fe-hydrogenase I cytochrome b subunit
MDAFSALRGGATLVATGIVRVYWLFAGNKFERLRRFSAAGRDWVNMWKQVKFYLMVHPERAPHYLGHNPSSRSATPRST